jgi:hypothetical protein
MMEAGNRELNPKFAHTLSGTIADERRHVGFGENRIGSLIREHPEKKDEIEKMQEEMTFYMLAAFADSFSQGPPPTSIPEAELLPDVEWHGVNITKAGPDEMEALLSSTVIGEFKTRLGRIGLDYRQPKVPA